MNEAEHSARAGQQEASLCGALKGVFGPRGVQHFVLDGVVHDLAAYTQNYLKDLAPDFQLELYMQQVRFNSIQVLPGRRGWYLMRASTFAPTN